MYIFNAINLGDDIIVIASLKTCARFVIGGSTFTGLMLIQIDTLLDSTRKYLLLELWLVTQYINTD